MYEYPYTYEHEHVYTALNTLTYKNALLSTFGSIFRLFSQNKSLY